MATTKRSAVRLTEAILDLEYGDEQERLRYYEAYAVMVHLQLIGLPLASAIAILIFGRSAALPVLILLFAGFLPVLVGIAYLRHRDVRLELIAASARNRPFSNAYLVAWGALIVALLVNSGFESDGAMALGAAAGAVIFIAVAAFEAREQRTDEPVDEDDKL